MFDIIILGGGTGGYVAAIRAGQLGLKVAVVERDRVGGTCLHRGCMPTKAFLRSAEVFHEIKNAAAYGLFAEQVGVRWEQVLGHKNQVVSQLFSGVQMLLKKAGTTVITGTGRLLPPVSGGTFAVAVDKSDGTAHQIEGRHIIIATGSRPRTLGLPIDRECIVTSDEAVHLNRLPEHAIVLGAGAIGMEWASLYADMGAKVTVLEAAPRPLPLEDEEISAEAARIFQRRGVEIVTGANIDLGSVHAAGDGAAVAYEVRGERRSLKGSLLLVSVGRQPNSGGIGLEAYPAVGVEKGFVTVDELGRTRQPGIYAIGDVVGGNLAHVAAHQGVIAVEHMAGLSPRPFDRTHVPRCVYTRPEVASVGLTEREAQEAGHNVKVGKFPFRGIGKALVHGDIDGFAKLVTDADTDEILGVHVIGPSATNLIGEAGLGLLLGVTAEEVSRMIHPHPTLSEVFGEAALAVQGRAIHM